MVTGVQTCALPIYTATTEIYTLSLHDALPISVVELLAPVRERYLALRADESELLRLLAVGADKARTASAPTIEAIYERMGFVRLEVPRP